VADPQMPAWIWGLMFLALASLVAGSLEQRLFDRVCNAVARRFRRRAAWRALVLQQRRLESAPDRATARGVDASAFQTAPRS